MARSHICRKLCEPLPALLGILLTFILFSALCSSRLRQFPWLKYSSGFQPGRSNAEHEDDEKILVQRQKHIPAYDKSHASSHDPDGPVNHIYGIFDVQHREIFSYASRNRKFWPISYEDASAGDPIIIPHPLDSSSWLLIVRRDRDNQQQYLIHSLFIDRGGYSFDDISQTLLPPAAIGGTPGEAISSSAAHTRSHTVRIFHGPEVPYVMHISWLPDFGFRIWIQDALSALEAFHFRQFTGPQWFSEATNIEGLGGLESSANRHPFMFWDTSGKMYVHQTLWPQRMFAPIGITAVVGHDIASLARTQDQMCYAKFLRDFGRSAVDIQQSSNSLSVTLCRRKDPSCMPDDANTFIMHIFNARHVYHGQSVYEPYVVLFQRNVPFYLHAIAQRPLWIHGRQYVGLGGEKTKAGDRRRPQKLNIISMAWQSHVQKYHGYIDDALFLGFGLEGPKVGFIDVVAGDLLQDLGYC